MHRTKKKFIPRHKKKYENIHDAKTHFSKLISRVESGEEVIIAKSGKPVAKIIHYEEVVEERIPGALKGQVLMSNDFNDPLPDDIVNAFYK